MGTVRDVTEPFREFLVPVPTTGDDICAICHRGGLAWPPCYSCNQTARQVTRPCYNVAPISLTAKSGQLYHMLKSYKGVQPSKNAAVGLAALLARQLLDHGDCIGEWDVITHVPSSGRHAGVHPLAKAMEYVSWLDDQHETLVERAGGELSHNKASDDAFKLKTAVKELRVLVVDDTWTTGATAQSVASTLGLGGAEVVAIVPIGRIVDPHPNYPDEVAWWDAQRKVPFDFDACCLD